MRPTAQLSTTAVFVCVLGCSESEAPAPAVTNTTATPAQSTATQGSAQSSTTANGNAIAASSTTGSTLAATADVTGTSSLSSTTDGDGTVTATATATVDATSGAATSTTGVGGAASSGSGDSSSSSAAGGSGGTAMDATLSFFVTSQTSDTGDLGGLSGADAICQSLAAAVGAGVREWRAYLSADSDPDSGGMPVNARDRIGQGPWVNANGVLVAENLDDLHSRSGDVAVFVDENGSAINGQWADSPSPNEHDILTGSTAEGLLDAGNTCESWTSDADDIAATVGHSDGLGPNMDSTGNYASWNSSHQNESCADTAPRGGAGKFYCFASD